MARPRAPCLMVWGTASGVGKSWLTTALCRAYARRGLRVAPFKAQNMSNNARVVRVAGGDSAWGEIGSAQYLQALAAGVVPDVRMNPVLLKPESDTRSQVVVWGQVDAHLAAVPWRERSALLWPHAARALDSLRSDHDLIVMEGAGSPAEINLAADDFVNLHAATHAQARAILVADIDRGGAFAHLHGTWALLPPDQRVRLRGFVLNKFRGDPALLDPAPELLRRATGVPVVATLPMWRHHGLPEEDAWYAPAESADLGVGDPAASTAADTVAVIAYPRISNLDEFEPLRHVPGLRLVWARAPRDLAGARWVILPGSKHTSSDLAWLRAQGLDAAIARHAVQGGAVLGICAGLQMLGEALIDPHGIDGNAPGLGLLPLVTVYAPDKALTERSARFGVLPAGSPWAALSGRAVRGYEIHHGRTAPHPGLAQRGDLAQPALFPTRGGFAQPVSPPGADGIGPDGPLGWHQGGGNVLGVYLHGLFEDEGVRTALFGAGAAGTPALPAVFDGLADAVERHFSPGFLEKWIE